MNALRLLSELILNNVIHKELFNYLLNSIINLEKRYFKKVEIDLLKKTALAKAYLPTIEFEDKDFKLKIEVALDKTLFEADLIDRKTSISYKYFDVDRRLQSNGYLSNGVYLNAFCVYDYSLNEFVPLTKFGKLFAKIDQIALANNQEL